MKLYTTQYRNNWELSRLGYRTYDITVKSGDKRFAPTWRLLLKHKATDISDAEYTTEFYQLMRNSYVEYPDAWMDLVENDEPLIIFCFCAAGCFCHRLLLVDIFSKICKYKNIPFEYMGEIIGVESDQLILK